MEIKELYIENFGKLREYKRSFTSGLNSFLEDNSFGKTTLSVFIKVMLFGFDDTKKTSLDENDRKKYTPWQGGAFGGWLIFSSRGTTYRIERTFGSKLSDDTFTLYNLDTGTTSSDYSEHLGEELFGIDSDGFERTVFLSEKNISGKNTNQTISAKLSNIVEVEGDIGDFDSAIKLLDERRKFYQKKGGSGEIRDIQNEILATDEEIKALNLRKDESLRLEAEIAELGERAIAKRAKKEELLARQRRENMEREQRSYKNQYSEMLGAMKIDEAREKELLAFFSKKVPTNIEIAEAQEAENEAKRLEKTLLGMGENYEFSSLKAFFAKPTDEAECDRMVALAASIEENKAKYTNERAKPKVADSAFRRVPTSDEITAMTHKLAGEKRGGGGGGIFLLVLGLIFGAVGAYLGLFVQKILFAVSGIGVLLIIVGILSLLKAGKRKSASKASKDVSAFIESVYGKSVPSDEQLSVLLSMSADLEKHNANILSIKQKEHESEALLEATERMDRELREFIERFPLGTSITPFEAANEIRKKYQRYVFLKETESDNETRRELYSGRIKSLREAALAFTSLFPTKTDNPISEIRTALAEYEILRGSLTRRREDAERFAKTHGISSLDDVIPAPPRERSTTDDELKAIDEELLAIEKERSARKINYNNCIRDTDRIDELAEKREELEGKILIYNDNLNIIKKTMALLETAKSNMTAKYLDGTRRSFHKYVSLIDETDGEFTMDTSFTVMKTDMGKSRQTEAYSRGTRDLHSLSVRLALIDSLYEGEKPPIILDDPFTSFDDKHTERGIALLKKLAQDRQIFYFTCSKARRAK